MQARPLRIYKTPAYPTRLEVLADPHLLKENLPAAWRFAPQMAGVVAIMLAANACVSTEAQVTSRSQPTSPEVTITAVASRPQPTSPEATRRPQPTPPVVAIVAPIFEHGDGRGIIGCVVVSPPVYLSEEEALQIITEEFSRAGIGLAWKDVELPGVVIQWRELEPEPGEIWAQKSHELEMGSPLLADLMDKGRAIAIEYVSEDDFEQLRKIKFVSSAWGYDTKEVAQDVASTVEKEGKGVYFGTFYDPVVERKVGSGREGFEAAEEEAKELIRQQVQDFIEWLQAQGVI